MNGVKTPSLGSSWPLHVLESLQISRDHYWQALCEFPAYYTPFQQINATVTDANHSLVILIRS